MFLEPSLYIEVLGGLGLGIFLGWALQKGGFCMNTAFRSILFEKDRSLLQAWFLVLLINVPAVLILTELEILFPASVPFFWPALIIGGLAFGVGMVLAGGCASGTYYRAGRGMLGSWGALIGFLLGTSMVDYGFLQPTQGFLRSFRVDIKGEELTLFRLLGLEESPWKWLVLAALLVPLVVFLIRAPKQKFLIGWGWKKTGFIVGGLALAVWLVSALLGRDFGLSFTQPSSALTAFVTSGETGGIGLPFFLLLGVPLGSFLSAHKAGEAKWQLPSAKSLVRQSGGGLLMGVGAAIAGGCNIGHGISGLATLSLGSVLGVVSIMAGCWLMTALVMQKEKRLAALQSAAR
jgi:uncharacterized membrane protein YedE/YeeE